MAAAYQQQLIRICGKEETLRAAKELLNVARSKTGPGSGHDLGKKANALPAICALLASERLGNNDVIKKVAQDVSCLRPKDFEAALKTVRGALVNYPSRTAGSDVEMEDAQVEAEAGADFESSEVEEAKPPPCRHNQPILADRLFYHYRDPRVLREWEICEKNMKALMEKYGDPFGKLANH